MPKFSCLLLLLCASCVFAQVKTNSGRSEALEALVSQDAAQRVEAVSWIAANGKPSDAEVLVQHLTDESPLVRSYAEQGLWVLWSRSGDAAIDALMTQGAGEMESDDLGEGDDRLLEITDCIWILGRIFFLIGSKCFVQTLGCHFDQLFLLIFGGHGEGSQVT